MNLGYGGSDLFFRIVFFGAQVRHQKDHVFLGHFEVENGTPNSLKYDIYPHGLVVLMIIVITEATLRIDSKYLQLR